MDRRVWGLGLVASLIATVGVVACRQLVGITDDPLTDLTSKVCGLPYGTSACASCVQASCCAESTACAADPACVAYETCLGKCNGDPGCRSQCIADNPVGTSSDVSALSACLASNCETACGLTCGAVAGYIAPPEAGASCEACLQSNGACDPARACGSSVDCEAYVQCAHAFTTPDWIQACATQHDAGAALYARLGNLAAGPCATDCAYGQDWRCVGHVTWPTPVATTTTVIQEAVHDGLTAAPLANAQALWCTEGAETLPCDHPVGQCESNDAGYCAAQVPTAQGNSTNLTGAEDFQTLSAPGYLTSYGYGFEPVSQATLTLAPGLSLFLFTASETAALYASVGARPQVPGTGTVLAVVFDCQWHTAPGVQVTTDNPAVLGGGQVDGGPTTASGDALFVSVPVGNLTLTMTPVGLGKATGHVTFYVNPSAWTALEFGPQP
jgi:hypothetical protein